MQIDYCKLQDGALLPYDGSAVRVDDMMVFNPKDETLVSLGWKPLTVTDAPEYDALTQALVETYTESAYEIVQGWEIVAYIPPEVEIVPDEPTDAERIAALEARIAELEAGGVVGESGDNLTPDEVIDILGGE